MHDEVTDEIRLLRLPSLYGDHIHIGRYVVSARDASGLSNNTMWTALERKALLHRVNSLPATLTKDELDYNKGLADKFWTRSDH